MQEAYWLWHIKYYSVGYPPCQGTPPARSDGGIQSGYPLEWVPPGWGTPRQVWQGVYLRWGTPPSGYPQPGLTGGTRGGVPPHLDLAGPPRWTWLGYPPPGPGWDTYAVGKNKKKKQKHCLTYLANMPILQATSPAVQATVMCQAVSRGNMMKVTMRSAIDRCIINKFTRDFRCLKKEK